MHIQVNTTNTVDGTADLIRTVEEEIRSVVGRFSDRVTRLEVHIDDVNADREGGLDKRCTIEVRLAGRLPEAVTHEGATVQEACGGAARKLRRTLDATLGRLADRKGAASIRTGA
jgi:hypothetical protein